MDKLFYSMNTEVPSFTLWVPLGEKKYVSIDASAQDGGLTSSRDDIGLLHKVQITRNHPLITEVDLASQYTHLLPEFLEVRSALDRIVFDHAMECGACYENQIKLLQENSAVDGLIEFARRVYTDIIRSDSTAIAYMNYARSKHTDDIQKME